MATTASPAKARAKARTKAKTQKKAKSPRCRTCGQTIRVPKGWSMGPAVRRHYWAKHREVMPGGNKS